MRIVLSRYEMHLPEEELYRFSKTDIGGTLPSDAVAALRMLGFNSDALRLQDINALHETLRQVDVSIIAYVNLAPSLGVKSIHLW